MTDEELSLLGNVVVATKRVERAIERLEARIDSLEADICKLQTRVEEATRAWT